MAETQTNRFTYFGKKDKVKIVPAKKLEEMTFEERKNKHSKMLNF